MFILNNTYEEVMSDETIQKYVKKFILDFILESVNPEKRTKTLEQIKNEVKMPWGGAFPSEDIIAAANFALELTQEKKYEIIPIWKEILAYVDSSKEQEEDVYVIAPSTKTCKIEEKKPAVLICPGGGYSHIAMPGEGIAYAKYMEKSGYVPFVLKYSVSPKRFPQPQKDLALAIKYIRSNAEQYGIDVENILLMGSSAGGHLCASLSALHTEIEKELMEDLEKLNPEIANKYRNISVKPTKLSLSYPVISFRNLPNNDPCFQCLTGGKENLKEKVSVEMNVDKEYPKTFIWLCEDDELVAAEQGKLLYRTLVEKNVESRLCVYPTGGHGCGLAQGTSASGWTDEMLEFMKDSK